MENRSHFDDLNEAAVTAVYAVVPVGVTMEQCLHALLALVMKVMNYGIRQGAPRALATAQLRRGGLRGLEPGFLP